MAFNILDAVKGFLTPDTVGKAASYLGESDSSIGRALSGLIPTTLLGITSKAEMDGGDSIMDLAKRALNTGILNNLGDTFSSAGGGIPESSPGLLSAVLGDKVGGIANAIAQFAGIKGSSAASLLGSIVPLVLGVLGKHAGDNGLSGSGLLSLLSGQKSSFQNALPGGVNLSGLFGGRETERHDATHATTHTHKETVHTEKKSGSWLMPLLLGLAAVALLLYLMKGCNGADKEEIRTETPVAVPDTTATIVTPVTPTRESLKVKLADNSEIDAYRGGIEDKLVNCLNDSSCTAGKDRWFDFDNINFEVGSARLTAESQAQVNNIVAILKAYPKAKIKIGGYTDKTGDDAANKKLSQERADAVLAAIKAGGANAAQLEGAEGYGEDLAKIAEDASDEERRADRRISVQLREK
ncbi:OmpA family protein [Flavihumibacter sediminis]|nr:OmpA family protein [Flavihumibacter sediminis]